MENNFLEESYVTGGFNSFVVGRPSRDLIKFYIGLGSEKLC